MIKKIILFNLILALALCTGDFSSTQYQVQKRSAKLNQLWTAVLSNTNSDSFPTALQQASILLESMDPSIQTVGDQLPEGRKKLVHSVGSVGKAEFIPEADSPYTGFFQGADSLIIRYSVAKEPDYSKKEAKNAYDNFAPGLAVKYMIDGKPSANFFAMHGVNGVNSYNFFDQYLNTHIPLPEGGPLTLIANKFSSGTKIVQYLGLRKLAEHTQDGKPVSNPKFPYMLTLKPVLDVKRRFTRDFTEDFRTTFRTIPVGTVLFDVYAVDSPVQTCEKKIGVIRSTSIITPSYFGDTGLFFQHQDYFKDLEVHPEWDVYTPRWQLFGNRKPNKAEGKCPYAALFDDTQ